MTTYTDVFTGSTIYPAEVNLTQLDLIADITLYWPQEAQPNVPLVSSIVEILTTTSSSWIIKLPDATMAATGQTILFNNLTASSISVKNANNMVIASVGAGEQWQLYLYNNETLGGGWRIYQFGAGISEANAGALQGYGIKAIGSTLNQSARMIGFTGDLELATSDRASFYNFLGSAGGVSVTLPNASVVGNDWFVRIRNSGTASFTVSCPDGCLINNLSSLTFNEGDSALVATDGTNFFTNGFGQNPVFAFDYVVIDVTGSSDYVLSGYQLNRIAYSFIGVLGADITVIVPNTVQQYWVQNATDAGAFSLSIGTVSQLTPLTLVRGETIIAFSNGTDIIPTTTASVAAIVNGGTY